MIDSKKLIEYLKIHYGLLLHYSEKLSIRNWKDEKGILISGDEAFHIIQQLEILEQLKKEK